MTGWVVRSTLRLRTHRQDIGAATVLAVGVMMVCVAMLAGALEVARTVVTSHRAAAAADLAALAAAQEGPILADTSGCRAAARVASRNGASLQGCVAGPNATVTVWVSVVSTGPWPRRAVARSRAGPVEATQGSSAIGR